MLKLKEIWTSYHGANHITDNKDESNRNSSEILWKPLGRLPNWSRDFNTNNRNKKVNRYLIYQENRILKSVQERKYQKAALIWMILLKNSYGYQLTLFNKVMPEWHYMLSRIEAKVLMTKVVNKCRKHDLWLRLRRFYILKADGVRWRPIGCPDYPSRVISRSLNDLIYVLFEDKFNKNQHGFRKNRGAHTAILDIVNKLKKSPSIIYEFDLKSFFNTVRPMWVYRSLLARSSLLAEVIYKIIMQIEYKLPSEVTKGERIELTVGSIIALIGLVPMQMVLIYYLSWPGLLLWGALVMMILENTTYKSHTIWKDIKHNVIKKERELHCNRTEKMNINVKGVNMEIDAPYIIREGLPQGLSISPVLATLTMEIFKNPDELTLYADDGTYIGNSMKKFLKWKQDMSLIGAELAEEKSRHIKGGNFKFLGCIIDIDNQTVEYKGIQIKWNDEAIAERLSRLYSEEPYKKNTKGWTWKVKKDSITALNLVNMKELYDYPIYDIILIYLKSVIWGVPHKGFRRFRNIGIIDILGASSFACNELVKSKSELNLVATRPLSPIFRGKLSNFCINKSNSYYEEIYENNLRHYIQSQDTLKGWNNVLENYWDQ